MVRHRTAARTIVPGQPDLERSSHCNPKWEWTPGDTSWRFGRDRPTARQDIYGRYAGGFCNDDGWGVDEFIVNQNTAGNQYNPSLGFKSNDGAFVVSWTDDGQDGNAAGIYAQRFDWCGGRIGSEFQVACSHDTVYTVSGGGSDIWGSSDQFNFASESLTGDGEIIAKVDSLDNTDYWAKACVMFRDSLNPSSASCRRDRSLRRTAWNSNGGPATDAYAASTPENIINAPVWVKLTRVGNDFSAYYSTDGVTWIQLGTTQHIDMQETIQAGLAVTAHNNGSLCTAKFSNVTINGTKDFALADADIGSPGQAGSYSVSEVNTSSDAARITRRSRWTRTRATS